MYEAKLKRRMDHMLVDQKIPPSIKFLSEQNIITYGSR